MVDEINQGMDRINERKVFIQMVIAACQPGTPQCFMFTPKLLPDLPYTYDVMPMTIFNGQHSDELAADFSDVSLLVSALCCQVVTAFMRHRPAFFTHCRLCPSA